jgi:hypothetical protein
MDESNIFPHHQRVASSALHSQQKHLRVQIINLPARHLAASTIRR